jgi:hypothetical protein
MVLCFVLFYVYFEFYKSFTAVFLYFNIQLVVEIVFSLCTFFVISLFSIMCYYLITVTVFYIF